MSHYDPPKPPGKWCGTPEEIVAGHDALRAEMQAMADEMKKAPAPRPAPVHRPPAAPVARKPHSDRFYDRSDSYSVWAAGRREEGFDAP